MEFITPSATLIKVKNPYKKIELAGRTCYKSEDKITNESASKFTRGLIKSQHVAMIEHQVFTFDITDINGYIYAYEYIEKLCMDSNYVKWSAVDINDSFRVLVSMNLRAINECPSAILLRNAVREVYPDLIYTNDEEETDPFKTTSGIKLVDFDMIENPTYSEILAHKFFTFRFITDRGVTHEMVRHRPASYAQESTRYVNYKVGINIALPTGFYEKPEEVQKEYEEAFWDAEKHYCKLIEFGEKPQQARAVLPNALKTEIVMTANMEEWMHVFDLRSFGTTGVPHPDIKTVMDQAVAIVRNDPMIRQCGEIVDYWDKLNSND